MIFILTERRCYKRNFGFVVLRFVVSLHLFVVFRGQICYNISSLEW